MSEEGPSSISMRNGDAPYFTWAPLLTTYVEVVCTLPSTLLTTTSSWEIVGVVYTFPDLTVTSIEVITTLLSTTSLGSPAATTSIISTSSPTTAATFTSETSSISAPEPPTPMRGLSRGSTIAIGVVIPLVVIISLLIWFLVWRRRKRQATEDAVLHPTEENNCNEKHELEGSQRPMFASAETRTYAKAELPTKSNTAELPVEPTYVAELPG
ncbi:hypothetical protein F4819DRAFT_493175 [Hypoxylon fuscum]|nr:hypothetical protein F4819DRAFT_493175 [Hypoxylon fuscum]